MFKLIFVIFIFLSFFFSEVIFAGIWKTRTQSEFRFESRVFKDDHNSKTQDSAASLYTHLEQKIKKDNMRGELRVYSRVDALDNDRTILVIEDLWMSLKFFDDLWKLKIGMQTFNWSATEAFHPADIINSTNFDSDFEKLEKKGELTLQLERSFDQSSIRAFLFPYFTTPIFPGARSRFGQNTKLGEAQIIDSLGKHTSKQWVLQWGIQIDHSFRSADFSFHYLNHIDRYIPIFTLSGATIHPNYLRVKQFGMTYQQAIDQILLKFEAVHRNFDNTSILSYTGENKIISDHFVGALGLEYTNIFENHTEVTYIIELQSIFGVAEKERRQIDLFDRDFLFGIRYNLNDPMGREFFLGYIRDFTKVNESLSIISFSQRISDEYKIQTGARFIMAKSSASSLSGLTGLEPFNGDNYIYFNISRFF